MTMTLDEIIKKATQGDPSAQSAIIELTQVRLFKFCILLGHNRELAEDLCQDVYIKAFQNLKKLEKSVSLQSWLSQIAKNLFIDHVRLQTNKMHEPLTLEKADPSSLDEILQVQRTLAQFEPEERFLLILVGLEGSSYSEAAELTGLSEDAVRSKLHRLKSKFVSFYK